MQFFIFFGNTIIQIDFLFNQHFKFELKILGSSQPKSYFIQLVAHNLNILFQSDGFSAVEFDIVMRGREILVVAVGGGRGVFMGGGGGSFAGETR